MTIETRVKVENEYPPQEQKRAASLETGSGSEPEVAAGLVRRIAAGDSGAEGEMFERYGRGILVLLQRQRLSKEAAQDLRQETFRIAFERLRRQGLAEPARLAGFLRGTAIKLALAERRKSARHRTEGGEEAFAEAEDPAPSPLQATLAREESEQMDRLIASLSTDRDRQLLRRFYLAGEDREQISADLGLDRVHFNRVLFRARRRLQELANGLSPAPHRAALAGGH